MATARAFIAAYLLAFTAAQAPAQAPPPGRIPYRALTWADFKVDDASPGMSAQTRTYLSQQYTARAVGTPGDVVAWVAAAEFEGGFDRRGSWRRSKVSPTDRLLLTHEQGHLDITELKRRQLRALTPEQLPRGSGANTQTALDDLSQKMARFYREQVADMDLIQRRYDRETAHGTRRDVQAAWTARLRSALAALPDTPGPPAGDGAI